MDIEHVDDAIVGSYRELRMWVGILALLFPVLLIGWGRLWGIEVQQTMSNYYYAPDAKGSAELFRASLDMFPVRLWFCGILFIVGFFLHKYHGFSKWEDILLSAAGWFAIGVAVFPMSIDGRNEYDFVTKPLHLPPQVSLHGIFAVLAFLSIGIVIVFFANATLSKLKHPEPVKYKLLKAAYLVIAAGMVGGIGYSIIENMLHPEGVFVLRAEWVGVWSFAAYWFVKNYELDRVRGVLKQGNERLRAKSEADLADRL